MTLTSTALDASFPFPGFPGSRALFCSAPAAPPRTLLDVLRTTAARHPDAPALDTGDRVLTYRELCAEAHARALRLAEAGIGPGDRVGVRVASGTADLYLAILATLACGAAYVPVDADDPEDRAVTVFREAAVCHVLGAKPGLTELVPATGAGRAPTHEDDAWIIFTSGSTGAPKGVAVSHRSAAAFVDAEADLFLRARPLAPGDRVLAGLSVAFDASCEEMWLAWRSGACLVPAERALVRAGHELGPWLEARAITAVSTVPTLLAMWPEDALRRVRLLILGGEACPPGLVERFARPGREMWNTYGPTETTVVACAALLRPGQPVRIGLPLAGWELAVVDESGDPVPYGEQGELVIAGAGTARYLDPVKDADRFRPCPALATPRAYRSGDLVRADPEGLVFLGRADDQVKLGGRRVELGEIDAALLALPGVRAAAAAVQNTASGAQVLVGYVVPEPGFHTFQADKARELLSAALPAPLVPVLAEVADLPTKASGKADRKALPWPVPLAGGGQDTAPALHGTAARLADVWEQLLGLRPGPHSDFVQLGGTSLTAARMASLLRPDHPGVSVADLYRNPVLTDMAAHLDSLAGATREVRPARPVPRSTGAVQFLVSLVGYGITGLRGLVGLAIADNVLGWVAPHQWAPHTSWWLILAGWLLLFSAPLRCLIGAGLARALAGSITPGAHPRGGAVHLRLWSAERAVAAFGVPSLTGTPWAPLYARLLGCRTGHDVHLHALPPVTGLADLGAGSSVEPEADLAGWWLDGDTLHVGPVTVGAGARVGHRSTLMPGAVLGAGAELTPGGCLDGRIPDGETWTGSPARPAGPAARLTRPARHHAPTLWRPWHLAYGLSLTALPLLSLLAAAPALALTWLLVRGTTTLSGAAAHLLLAAPLLAVLTYFFGALLTAGLVRALGRGITPGLHRADGGVAWRAWLVTRVLDGARAGYFPLYASLATPHWMRLLGARVGKNAEISTVLPLPSLMEVADGAFLADDTLVAPYELRDGWMKLSHVRIGERAFLGNSGIAGHDVPDHGLIGVLSDAPAHSTPGTSWIGRPAMALPRKSETGDQARTFAPPRKLVRARAAVEACRVVPLVIGTLIAELLLLAQQRALDVGQLPLAALAGVVLLPVASLAACLITTGAKWLLVGRFTVQERPLWSSFVWRNELFDTFYEMLAVPWGMSAHLGTPVLNWWLRTLGARIGRGVWLDTYWLPETDLITIGDGASVNRGCVLQTHLFHDRIMRMDTVQLAAGASLGPHSIALPATVIGTGASVGAASLVMRGESVPDGTRWAGNPIAGVRA